MPMPPIPQLDSDFFNFTQSPIGREIAAPYGSAAVVPDSLSPACTIFPPWEHQLKAYRALWNATALLIDLDCRAGKTKVIIDYLCNKPIADVRRTLVICPKTVIPVWEEEAQKHAGKPIAIAPLYKGSISQHQKEAQRCLEEAKRRGVPALCVINPESSWREPFGAWALAVGWSLLVLDECHALAGVGSKQSRFAHRLRNTSVVAVGLSGSPFPQGQKSVYGVYRALDPLIFGTNYKRFESRYFIMGGFESRQVVGLLNQPEMKAKVNSIRLHIKATDLQLPPVVESHIPVIFPPAAWKIYREMEEEYYAQVAGLEFTAASAAVVLIRLQQITSGFLPNADDPTLKIPLHTAKRDALVDFLSGLPSDEPVVVFCRFLADITSVHEAARLVHRTSSELSGRLKTHQDWRKGTTSVLACQIRAAAEGINLSRSNYVVYYSLDYSWKNWLQSQERVRIHGKTASIGVYYLTARGTVDERIERALRHRGDVIKELMTIPKEKNI